ncbi:MAG: LIC10012 family protein [Leptospira bouyouniensis]
MSRFTCFHVIASLLIFFAFFPKNISAKEISILPAYISGDVPPVLGTRREASFELSRLSRHYLKRNFFTEITDSKIIENYLNETEWNEEADLKDQDFNGYCNEWDSHFVVQDQIDFGNPILVKTIIYNCKNLNKQIIQSKLISNFVMAYEKHNEKSFRFLPPRFYEKKSKTPVYYEINLFLDIHSAYAYYKKDILKSLTSMYDQDGLYLGVTLLKKDKTLSIPPTKEHVEIKKIMEETSWQGSNQSESILAALQGLKGKFSSGKKESRKLFLLLSSNVKDKSGSIIMALNDLRHMEIEPIILIPNHSDLSTIRELQRIGKASNSRVVGITEYQKIGTQDGYEYLYLNQFNVYSSLEELQYPFQWNQSNIKKFDASLVRAAVDVVTPYNLYLAYEKIAEKRVLEKEEIKTDLEYILRTESNSELIEKERFQTVLVESKGEAIWIQLPYDVQVTKGKEYLIQTTFVLDPLSTWGIKNVAAETNLLKTNYSYPKTLMVKPSQAKKFLDLNKIREFNGYLQGTVSVIKKR